MNALRPLPLATQGITGTAHTQRVFERGVALLIVIRLAFIEVH
jgi:hypothetical protein